MRLFLYVILLLSYGYDPIFAQSESLDILEDQANIRQEASTDAPIVLQVKRGKRCAVLSRSGFFETVGNQTDFWYEVQADGKKGWVFGGQTSKKLSANPQTHVLLYKRAERVSNALHLYFESQQIDQQGWKGHGTGVWDFGYGDSQNNYQGTKFYTGGKKLGNASIKGIQDKAFLVEWKVAPQTDADSRLSTDKEVPIILSIKKVKATKEPKPEKTIPNKSF